MTDLVVTVPRNLWAEWIEEGDAVGEPETGEEWGFFLGHNRPPILPGERLYIVAHDRLRGYAPVTRVAFYPDPCEKHSYTAHVAARSPSIEQIRELLAEAQAHCDGATALLCTDALDTTMPTIHRLRCRDEIGRLIAPPAKDPACACCQLEVGTERPWIDGRLVTGRWAIGRKGGAVAVTIPDQIRGFRGFRPPWWDREQERPFPGWIETDLWLNRAKAKAKRETAKARAAVPTSPDPQGELF